MHQERTVRRLRTAAWGARRARFREGGLLPLRHHVAATDPQGIHFADTRNPARSCLNLEICRAIRAAFGQQQDFLTKNPEAFQLRDSLILKEKCSKEDSNLHGLPH